MNSTKWRDLVELIGIAAIVASLIFVGLQLRQDEQVAWTETLVAGQFTEFEVSRLIGENSDVWVRGLNNEELTRVEEATFEAVSNAVFRYHANSFRMVLARGVSDENNTVALNYAFLVYQYSGLRRKFYERVKAMQLRDRAYGHSDRIRFFSKVIDEYLQHLDATSPEVPTGNYVPL